MDLERLYRIVDVLTAIGQERGVSPAQVALNWVMNKPGVDTVILGARNEEQLRDNLAAATWRLTDEEMAGWTRSAPCRSRIRTGTSTSSGWRGTRGFRPCGPG